MTLTRLIMRCIWLAMRERQGDSHENDGYIDSRRSPKLFGVRSDLRNDGRSLLEFRTPSQTIQQDVYRSRTEADSPHQSHCSQMVSRHGCAGKGAYELRQLLVVAAPCGVLRNRLNITNYIQGASFFREALFLYAFPVQISRCYCTIDDMQFCYCLRKQAMILLAKTCERNRIIVA